MDISFQHVIIGLSIFIAILILLSPFSERFSSSGLAISDKGCDHLASVYYGNMKKVPDYKRRICSHDRLNDIDFVTGNYERIDGRML